MKRVVVFFLLIASGATQAASWSDLWVTHDDRQRAYEEIQAGEYASAAKRLEHFDDPQSQYNRGNALARGGKLENALAAYDSAIKQTHAGSELGRDARHNRDLVAEQLKQRQSKQQQQQQGEQSQQGQQGQQNSSSGQKQDEADAKRDAESAMAQQPKPQQQPKPGSQSKGEKGDQNAKPVPAAVDQPPSEQALALDQWLRQIPDDPSGLLRRKFWIEHLRSESEARR